MTVTLGTNAGFVTVAPTADPDGTAWLMSNYNRAQKDTAPADATEITEIGWYCQNATEAANFEVCIYSDISDFPIAVVGSISDTNAKGTTAGWKSATGLSIPIVGGTDYWIAVECDFTATATNTDRTDTGVDSNAYDIGRGQLDNPWEGGAGETGTSLNAIYAVYNKAVKINIGDSWKQVEAIKINIGDAWKTVSGLQININGSEWKTVLNKELKWLQI